MTTSPAFGRVLSAMVTPMLPDGSSVVPAGTPVVGGDNLDELRGRIAVLERQLEAAGQALDQARDEGPEHHPEE